MAKIDVSDPKATLSAVGKLLAEYQGELICALQLWYQGLDGQGVPNACQFEAIQDAIANTPGWSDVGNVRDERFGMQKTYKRAAAEIKTADAAGNVMIQHKFKKEGIYKEPDGTLLRIATSEVWNLRCFEVKDGKQVGKMIRIHPDSDRAKALVEA